MNAKSPYKRFRTSRRGFMSAAGLALISSQGSNRFASALEAESLGSVQSGGLVRTSLADPNVAAAVQSYQKAVKAMIGLPFTDPRNWYRNAFIHVFDCPHSNWWFLPWHRGYLGWFERTCRSLSGDPNFALPYWDWTASLSIPSAFLSGPLDPASFPLQNFGDFQAALDAPMQAFYQGLTPDQASMLSARGFPTANALWDFLQQANWFFTPASARQPSFDASTQAAVSLDTIQSAVDATDFIQFGSGQTATHYDQGDKWTLESQPHDNVHGAIGGFMSAFLSPIDPLFFMHHANIDRLWDLWTRKQTALGLPTTPAGAALGSWNSEAFLFYVDPNGASPAKKTSGDYTTIGDFNYTYQPGSGEQFVPTAPAPAPAPALAEHAMFIGALNRKTLDFSGPTHGVSRVPEAIRASAATHRGARLFAKIVIAAPKQPRGVRFHVLVDAPADASNVPFTDPSFAGTINLFGADHHGMHAEAAGHPGTNPKLSFVVPLNRTLAKLRAAGRLKPNEPIRISVVPDTQGVTLNPFSAAIESIAVESF